MREFIRAIVAAVLAAGITISASAATLEEAYIAARDAAIAKIKADEAADKHGPMDPTSNKIIDEDDRARASLEQQMRAIVGPVVIKGMTSDAKINLDTLNDSFEGFGMLDGMVYGGLDDKTRVIVTTDSMFKRWLRDWWDEPGSTPQLSDAAKNNNFYTRAILTDAAVVRFADMPIRKPAGASFAYAMLAARTQSDVPRKADEIFVLVAEGSKIFLAYTREFGAVGPIAACDAIRSDLVKQSVAVAEEPGLDEKAQRKKSDDLSGKSESEFLRCFAEKASQQNSFAAATQAAQALLDRLPQR